MSFGDILKAFNQSGGQPGSMQPMQSPIGMPPIDDKASKNQKLGLMLYALGGALKGDKNFVQNTMAIQQMQEGKKKEEERKKRYNEMIAKMNPESPLYQFSKMVGSEGIDKIAEAQFELATRETQDRKIIKARDGFNYYADTGERVLPKVKEKDSIQSQTNEYKNYLNTLGAEEEPTGAGFLAYQDRNIKKQKMDYDMKQDRNKFWRYTEGPMKGQRVFPDVIEEKEPFDFANEDKLRDDFRADSKEFVKIRDAYGRILSTDATAAGDLALIFNYMKILDPGSVVREGEFATAQNSAGIPERIRAQYNRIKSGERLTSDTREDFLQQAKNLYQTQADSQAYLESEYKGYAEEYGFKPSRIVTEYGKPIEEKLFTRKLESMSLNELATLDPLQYSEKQLKILEKVLKAKGKP